MCIRDRNTPIKNLNFNGLQSKIKGLNAYWIFNYKKFSYPAAYSLSLIHIFRPFPPVT